MNDAIDLSSLDTGSHVGIVCQESSLHFFLANDIHLTIKLPDAKLVPNDRYAVLDLYGSCSGVYDIRLSSFRNSVKASRRSITESVSEELLREFNVIAVHGEDLDATIADDSKRDVLRQDEQWGVGFSERIHAQTEQEEISIPDLKEVYLEEVNVPDLEEVNVPEVNVPDWEEVYLEGVNLPGVNVPDLEGVNVAGLVQKKQWGVESEKQLRQNINTLEELEKKKYNIQPQKNVEFTPPSSPLGEWSAPTGTRDSLPSKLQLNSYRCDYSELVTRFLSSQTFGKEVESKMLFFLFFPIVLVDLFLGYIDSQYNKCYCPSCSISRGDPKFRVQGDPSPKIYSIPHGWLKLGLKYVNWIVNRVIYNNLSLHFRLTFAPQITDNNSFKVWHKAYHGTPLKNVRPILKSGGLQPAGEQACHKFGTKLKGYTRCRFS